MYYFLEHVTFNFFSIKKNVKRSVFVYTRHWDSAIQKLSVIPGGPTLADAADVVR